MSRARFSGTSERPRLTAAAIAVAVGAFAIANAIAADARWLAALGRAIVADGLPDGVPYATARSTGWENVPALGEVVFHSLDAAASERGFQLAQVTAVALCLTLLARLALREGATDTGTALMLGVVAVGAIPAFALARVQLFSLALFPVLLTLVHAESRRPSRRVWLLVPLVALWSNLHGAVLTGVAVAGAYLVVHRFRSRPAETAAVVVAMLASLCLTPSLWRTPSYYAGVLGNEAARRGEGLWAPISTAPLDLLLVAAALLLLLFAWRGGASAWEWVALAGLAVLTMRTARAGVWLLLVAAAPAARGVRARLHVSALLPAVAAAAGGALLVLGFVRGPQPIGASDETVRRAVAEARGGAVLAEPLLGEQLVLAGGTVWLANPLDAFGRDDQRLYLDWAEGTPAGDAAVERSAGLVLVNRGGDAERRLLARGSARLVARDADASLYAVG